MQNLRMKPQSLLAAVAVLWLLTLSCSTPHPATDEPKEAVSPTPAVTMTPIELPTPTPLPTLPAEEAQKAILDLLEDNGGCRLPCWWGLTPGETSVQEAQTLVERFGAVSIITIFFDNVGGTHLRLTENDFLLDISANINYDLEIPKTIKGLKITTQVNRELEEGGFEVVWENPLNAEFLQAYMLPQILTAYGPPSQVFVYGNVAYGHASWPLFELVLDYADRGFVIWYTVLMEREGDTYLGCMANVYTDLHLWDPDLDYTWAEGVTRTTGGEDSEIDWLNKHFLPLEEATSLTLDEFYEIFQNPENTSCLETPVEIWPGP
jgi:hypothetical protein